MLVLLATLQYFAHSHLLTNYKKLSQNPTKLKYFQLYLKKLNELYFSVCLRKELL